MNVERWPTQARFWLEWGATLLAKTLYDFNIRNYPQLVEKLRYIHRNPVRAELCLRPEDRVEQFSPLRNWLRGVVQIESDWTARKREGAAGDPVRLWN